MLVIGLGYVGLPLAMEACSSGLKVVGLDLNAGRVTALNSGQSHVDDISGDEIDAMLSGGFRAISDEIEAGQPEVVVICVPTPLSKDGIPDLDAVLSAARTAGRVIGLGSLVSLESTTYPGTTEDLLVPILEEESGLKAGVDFFVAFSPERIDPGNSKYGLRNTPKVVGGVTSACTEAAIDFYSKICDVVVPAKSSREAELTKLLENTYRHINIALVNEMAIFCHELEIDLRDSIRCASTKPFGFQAFYPGPGVGGHCIPIDPNYLSYKVRELGYPFRFVELAQEVNGRMPSYVADRVAEQLNSQSKAVNGARVLLLGITYKENISDQRESPAVGVAESLRARGAILAYHDPMVQDWMIGDQRISRELKPHSLAGDYDIVVLLQNHRSYDLGLISRMSNLFFDTRGALSSENVSSRTAVL